MLTLGATAPASALSTAVWPCSPVAVYVAPDAGFWVTKAVRDWHRSFRPDFTFTTDPTKATILVRASERDFAGKLFRLDALQHPSEPAGPGDGVTGMSENERGVLTYAEVIVSRHLASTTRGYNVAVSELLHVSGIGYEDVPATWTWAGHDGLERLTANEMGLLRWAGRRCMP